mmetsp:Transcript_141672/g.200643  ORF Transcript_141672/g.200643 Transcript_141672/m.200643 type:complete len:149 (+) Transcript_141672:44-490(+)
MARLLVCLGLVIAAWNLVSLPAFCGSKPVPRDMRTSRDGWRMDLMEFGPKGIGQLVIHEGYFVGEKGFYDIQSKQGRTYRMYATGEALKEGAEDVVTQLGPLKLRLGEIFGGTCAPAGMGPAPKGYRGCAGMAAWGDDLPESGGGYSK